VRVPEAATDPTDSTDSTDSTDTFPRQYARTRRLSLGEPRSFRIAPDGTRIAFLRSRGGSDPLTCLWVLERTDALTGQTSQSRWHERLVCDPRELLGGAASDGDVPPAERARRERLREQADGITSFDTDLDVTSAVFTLAGHIVVASLVDTAVRILPAAPGAFDPRLSPNGHRVAYIADRTLRVVSSDGTDNDTAVIGEDDPNVSWGTADFNAAEEFNRQRGFWWSPDSTHILAARVDDTPVRRWYIADPANPGREPNVHRYPEAGTANAIVTLTLFDLSNSTRADVPCTPETFPYLLDVKWTATGLIAVWANRAQTVQRIVRINPITGSTSNVRDLTDPVWIELAPGTPVMAADGGFLSTSDQHPSHNGSDPEGTTTLARFGPRAHDLERLTPPNLQVRKVLTADAAHALVAATVSAPIEGLAADADPAQQHLIRIDLKTCTLTIVAGGSADPGVHDGVASGNVAVVRSASIDRTRADVSVRVDNIREHTIENFAEIALVDPRPIFFRAGDRQLPCCVLLPTDLAQFGDPTTRLPVLLDPYGGPHAQRVVASRNAHTTSQWFADQGFIVLVVDGRGTPGLGPRFEQAVHGNLADPVLEDQATGLHEAAERFPQMDLTRVAIRGWSFGGYLAALAVLKRPDVFHAAIAGAPVTEWRLYDTGYTERYLGNPSEDAAPYERSSLLPLAAGLERPLMLIHGLADDNVVAAHTLRLSSALLAAGRPHEVLPLSGVTHMTPQEVVAENLLKLQVDFLRRSLNNHGRCDG
jgi:dipeptidyl-peptidase 4